MCSCVFYLSNLFIQVKIYKLPLILLSFSNLLIQVKIYKLPLILLLSFSLSFSFFHSSTPKITSSKLRYTSYSKKKKRKEKNKLQSFHNLFTLWNRVLNYFLFILASFFFNGMTLSTLSINSHDFTFSFPK